MSGGLKSFKPLLAKVFTGLKQMIFFRSFTNSNKIFAALQQKKGVATKAQRHKGKMRSIFSTSCL
jgi:hypothetical protein